ncbi:MAG: hypothetical protein EA417_07225 [Gammaproteobacteria bacterium]|nr:MAG: hypothetical protein EA417_07225 [Gammaproteobacteria bacterium]
MSDNRFQNREGQQVPEIGSEVIRDGMLEKRSSPQVFIDGQALGGADELETLLETREAGRQAA